MFCACFFSPVRAHLPFNPSWYRPIGCNSNCGASVHSPPMAGSASGIAWHADAERKRSTRKSQGRRTCERLGRVCSFLSRLLGTLHTFALRPRARHMRRGGRARYRPPKKLASQKIRLPLVYRRTNNRRDATKVNFFCLRSARRSPTYGGCAASFFEQRAAAPQKSAIPIGLPNQSRPRYIVANLERTD